MQSTLPVLSDFINGFNFLLYDEMRNLEGGRTYQINLANDLSQNRYSIQTKCGI